MPLPPSLDTFRTLANSAFFSSRDIAVKGEGKTASARLGNFVFSQSAKINDATMKAFKAALEEEYGVFGRHAFDSVLGQRAELHKSLRACDVKATLSSLAIVRKNRFVAEANRQLDTAPKMLELSKADRLEVRRKVAESISKGVDLSSFKTKQEVSAAAQRTIDAAISKLQLERSGLETRKLGPQEKLQTEAKPYQAVNVDGHLNMPRGYDVPTGAGGLLNGMRTFHYFTIPDTDHVKDAGGSGPRRRLFLKCETFGIFASTAHLHPFRKADARSDGMKTRGYRTGDILESIQHGASLFRSWFTPKEAPGIRKENLTEAQKKAIRSAKDKLEDLGLGGQGELLVANAVLSGGGIKTLTDNVAFILEKMMPEDEEKRVALMSVLEDLAIDFEASSSNVGGEIINRIGNEIMIDAKDLM